MKVSLFSTTLALMTMSSSVAAFSTPRVFLARSSAVVSPAPSFELGAVPDGWVGGFAESNPDFAYPRLSPDLSDLPILDNMANIDLLTRQQRVPWPQFSWLAIPGNENSRVYQMFAPDISRLGYTDEGRIYSIICPQQGFGSAFLGTLNVEVTVTGQRGWVDEPDNTVYGDLGVKGRIWISEGSKTLPFIKDIMKKYDTKDYPFSKANAVNITTHRAGQPWNPMFNIFNGTDPSFPHPSFAQHWEEAYGVGYLNVEIGGIESTGNDDIDRFNQMVLDVFNLGSGNILKFGSTLSWNVWFSEPELLDRKEWAEHAEKWRHSIDVNHTSPTGDGSKQTYFDGRIFKPLQSAIGQELKLIKSFLTSGTRPRSSAGRLLKATSDQEEEDDDDDSSMLDLMTSIDHHRYE
jgi:hypothetical protein